MKLVYEVGDPCWISIAVPGEDGEYLTRRAAARVVFWFDLPDDPMRLFLVRLDDPDWAHYEVRDALMMAATEDGLMPFHKAPHA